MCAAGDRLTEEIRGATLAVRGARSLNDLQRASDLEHAAVEALAAHVRDHGCDGHFIDQTRRQTQPARQLTQLRSTL